MYLLFKHEFPNFKLIFSHTLMKTVSVKDFLLIHNWNVTTNVNDNPVVSLNEVTDAINEGAI